MRSLAFFVDAVIGLVEYPDSARIDTSALASKPGCIVGVVKLDDEMMLIHDLDKFLSSADENLLDRALSTV